MNLFRNPWAIVLLVVLVILLFGANKLPGLARNMGKSMRIFKSEVEELRGDDKDPEVDEDEERPARSSRPRDDRDSDRRRSDDRDSDDRAQDQRPREGREYDPRDDVERDREPVRPREDGDSYRRD